jgi:hypothetical protein
MKKLECLKYLSIILFVASSFSPLIFRIAQVYAQSLTCLTNYNSFIRSAVVQKIYAFSGLSMLPIVTLIPAASSSGREMNY